MVKQKKTDRDKWYYAAKEQGYRSRAAFKLTQLNKKFNFLAGARACLDLCAAPGGWLQVAAKYMPVSSVIIGVDLLPIRPIRNVVTLKEDITTQKCRHEIKKHLKGWKVDVCIHDGAPNLGSAWVQDAYGQNTLTLAAVGLAVDFLREGGTFVTKVFRSADYNSLLWVFNQLFKKVTVTKPPASRNTSAEIFAVCEGFLAPKQLDPRFLDPKHVFKELDAPAEKELYLGQKRAKRHREGYDDESQLLYRKASVASFINTDNPTSVLANNHKLEFDDETRHYEKDRRTTSEIKTCLDDIQVLGRKEIKDLLRWRLSMIKRYKKKEGEENDQDADHEEEDAPLTLEEEEKKIDEEIEEKLTRAQQRKRQQKKKERKKAAKRQRRIDMKMDLVDDSFDLRDEEDGLFTLTNIKSKKDLEAFEDSANDPTGLLGDEESDEESDDSDDEGETFLYGDEEYDEELESQLEEDYKDYISKSKNLLKAALKRSSESKHAPMTLEMMDLKEKIENATSKSIYDSDSEEEQANPNPLLVPEAPEVISATRRASQWFSQELFDGVDVDMDMNNITKRKSNNTTVDEEDDEIEEEDDGEIYEKEDDDAQIDGDEDEMMSDEDTPKKKKDTEDSYEVVPQQKWDDEDEEMNDYEKAELLALGTLLKTGKIKLSDLIDDGFNRYTFNDDDLPTWFEQEERHHNKPITPVTKQMTRDILANNRAINARPIKKVAEAKARKKLKAKRKIDKIKKRANHIAVDNELSETAKARAIEKLYKSQMAKMKTKQVYVVRNKFQKGKARIGPKKSAGTKVKIVDKRMKADKRGAQASNRRSR